VDAASNQIWLARITDAGVVPATLVGGFEDRPAQYRPNGFTPDSRFALFNHYSNLIPDGVDVIDTWANARHWSVDAPEGMNPNSLLAPRGLWLSYWFGLAVPSYVARITADGATTHELPPGSSAVTFSASGTRVFYVVGGVEREVYVRELLAEPVLIDSAVAGSELVTLEPFIAGEQHVIASYSNAAGKLELRRLSTSAEPVLLSDPARSALQTFSSEDGTSLFLIYSLETTRELELVDATAAAPRLPVASVPVDVSPIRVGATASGHFWYNVGNTELHVIARDAAGELASVQVSEPGETIFRCLTDDQPKTPADKLVFMDDVEKSLVLVSLAAPAARRVTELTPAAGAQLRCPRWSPAGDAFAYSELDSAGSRIYLVRWTAADPEPPQLVHEADADLTIELTRP
jgi:hypothetical protein